MREMSGCWRNAILATLVAAGCAAGAAGDNGDGSGEGSESTDGGSDADIGPETDGDPDGEAGDGAGDALDGAEVPPVDEVCDDGLDNDGDTLVDEDCSCIPGEETACFHGTAEQRNRGICRDGTMTCLGGESTEIGLWGPCAGDVLPEAVDTCEAGGIDENCSGEANEGCECSEGDPPVACGSSVGACRPGTQSCVGGVLGPCTGAVGPALESCNGVDDDCNGLTDEGVARLPCGSAIGACRLGELICVDGVYPMDCVGAVLPTDETCNNIDDDCNGRTDDGLTLSCGVAVGACTAGTMTCTAGAWSACVGGTSPGAETCDGVDNDCDGVTDEEQTRSCGSDVGDCVAGLETCAGGAWGGCVGAVGPGTEDCNGGDEDCDGLVDESCSCADGATTACGTDVGECVAGLQTCSAGAWGPCVGAAGPATEVCNTLDDDCDGAVDEGLSCTNRPPVVTCPPGVTATVLTTVTLSGTATDPDGDPLTYGWTVIGRPAGSAAVPGSPASATTTFFLDASGTYVLQFCADDGRGGRVCCTVTVTSTAPGDLHVELSWSTPYGDADLHVLRPGAAANRWFTLDDCFFGNRTPDWGPVGAPANPTLDRDDTDGYGPENVTITDSPLSGTYVIGIAYYCMHSIGTGTIDPGSGPSEATVRIYCGGVLIDTIEGITLDSTGRWKTVAEVDWPTCTVRSRTTTAWSTEVVDPTLWGTPPIAFHCPIPCTTPGSTGGCPANEHCYSTRPPDRGPYCFYDS